MDTLLLVTKLRIPPQPPRALHRARLIDALERAIVDRKLILLCAPAGCGKTTLLSQWAHASRFPIAWLSIGREDNDLDRFFRYLLAAWEQIWPGVRESPLDMLLGAMLPDTEAVLSAFINVAAGVPGPMVFVLDDYHLVEEPAIHQAITFLLDHLPPTLHFVLAGRAEPPLPLARYRARRELLEFRAEDLQFLPPETADFFSEMMGFELADDQVARLQAQLEGWIAGLQLVGLTLQRRLAATDPLVVSGRQRFIADYLREDVLGQLADDVQLFLLQTSILDRLCQPVCAAVTGRKDCQALLERLERENVFLVPLDDNREWFRYHQLFADFLQEELNRRHPDEVAALHRRAALWYLAHDLPEPAFDHAVIADDADLVIRILERYLTFMLNCGELKVLARWLDALPAAWYSAHPLFNLFRSGVLGVTGAFDACLRCIDEAEQGLSRVESEEARWQLALVKAVRCFMACIQNDQARAEEYADQALRDLREESVAFRASIYHALGDIYRRNGRWEEAKACYHKVLGFAVVPGLRLQSIVQGVHVFGALADLALRQGRLQQAAGYWRKALAVIEAREQWGRLPLPLTGWVYLRMGEILYEWNELGAASEHAARGLERAELGGDVRGLIAGYVIVARLKLTTGDVETAAGYLERARPLVEQAAFSEWTSRFERLQIELWLAQDRLRAALNWADTMLRGDARAGQPESEATHLASTRVLIVKGDMPSLEHALELLKRLLLAAEAQGRTSVQIEVLTLQALADWRRGDQAGALTSLERALRLAEPEGYVRLFADLDLPMARLLQEARSRAVMHDYVGKLLAAFGTDLSGSIGVVEVLPEPLTSREQEILELIAAGLTNREIAGQLVLSPETVKKHTGSIYGKLGVRNRTEAVARARAIDLLD